MPLSRPTRLLSTRQSVRWLFGLAVLCLAVVLGLEKFFDSLQRELDAKSQNERARLFVGDEIVRGIQGVEKDMYRMVAATSPAALVRVRAEIDRQTAKLRHDLDVLKHGGTVKRVLRLNIEGFDEMALESTYRPAPGQVTYVMELIEVAPLLDQVSGKSVDLSALVTRRQDCVERQDRECLMALLPEISLFLKQLPPYFERLNENANRLFHDSNQQLTEIEGQLEAQGERLKLVEYVVVALVILLAGMAGVLLMRRINEANTQLEVAVEEMRAAKDEAERASRAKSEFVSRMSHELRTPLNAIIGFAELLEDEPLAPAHKNYVGLINSSGKHLMELINAVLDHAKIEAGGLTLEKLAFDFPAVIEDVRSIVSERASAKGLDFIASIDANLPGQILGDPTRLRQILINLLVNAVKFTEKGSVELRVATEDSRIVFSVRDTGIGMDAVALSRLFQPFSQADVSITRKYGGTGLGLIITKELIEAMGGAIEVESAPNVGTVFWFWLPLLASGTAAASPAPADLPEAGRAVRVPGRVLLVDDNRVNQQLAGAMLRRLGVEHDFADNGREALERLAGTDYALVLMDMEMPEMDGIAATRAIRAREAESGRAHLPVVAMTANALQEDRERCRAAGMDGYIAKPVSLAALREELGRHFGGAAERPVPSPGRPAAAALYDRATAIERLGDDEEMFAQVAEVFVADVPNLVAELDAALAAGDVDALMRVGHTLKGLFATFAVAKTTRDNRDGQVDTNSWVMTVWVAFVAAGMLTAWG
ncbi:MAG: response regulator, partial [Thiobacillus sp.]|nr:response regulator [Thiobacillus sp.]